MARERREATERRSQFETDRSAQSIRWLLANAVRQGMTVDDVNAAVQRHLQHSNLAVAVVTTDAEGFRDRLLSNQPSPPTYNATVSEEILAEDEAIVGYEIAINAKRMRVVPVEEMFRSVGLDRSQ